MSAVLAIDGFDCTIVAEECVELLVNQGDSLGLKTDVVIQLFNYSMSQRNL